MAFNFDDIELQGSAADDIDYTLEALKAMMTSQPANKFNIVLMEDCLCNLWRNCAKLGIPIPSEGYKAKTVTLKSFCNLQAKLIKAERHSKKCHSKGKEA